MSTSPKKVFVSALIVQVVYCALAVLISVWSLRIFGLMMIPYFPVAFAWERLLPWGRDRDQVAMALFLWVPLIGTLAYSAIAYFIARGAKKEPIQPPVPTRGADT
jgi:ABC-type phosphate transport system permease subunit